MISKKNKTRAQLERGQGILFSLKVVLNVLFSLLIFQVFLILPRPEDPELERLTPKQLYEGNLDIIMIMAVGLVLIVIYWIQVNKQLGNLLRSSTLHASLSLFQMVCLMLYMYFVRLDIEFTGQDLTLYMQSILLAMAGGLGALTWRIAILDRLTSSDIDEEEEKELQMTLLPEPLTAAISLFFVPFGSEIWSLCFLLIIPMNWVLRKVYRK